MSLLELPPGSRVDARVVEAWLATLPKVPSAPELAATPQDATYHAEGNVWTHTLMALAALVDGERYAALTPLGRRIAATAVALHDVGKPATTRDDGGRLVSRGHSARGENLARASLWRLGVSFAQREHVCALIRYHQIPFFGLDKTAEDAARLARRLSLVLRHDWLVAVADADARGRRCANPADQTRITDACTLWAEHARELAILDRAQEFPSLHARRVWFESPSRSHAVEAHDDTTCEVVLMSGLPASGKDSWLAATRPELPVVSLDDLRVQLELDPGDAQGEVIAAARERAREYLRTATSFAWNATNLTHALRAQLLELFRSYRARTHVVYCETSYAQRRLRDRTREARVPKSVVDSMIERWTVPDPSEAHAITYAVPIVRDAEEPSWPPRAAT